MLKFILKHIVTIVLILAGILVGEILAIVFTMKLLGGR